MQILSSLRGAACGASTRSTRKARVFKEVPYRLLTGTDHLSVDDVAQRLTKLWRLDDRFVGSWPHDPDTINAQYRIACYSLVYMSQNLRAAQLFLQAYVPLLREGVFPDSLRYRIARTFGDDVWHLLFDVQGLDKDDDFDPADWSALWNGYDDESLAPLLAIAGLPPFGHPWFPEQEVWLAHNPDPVRLGWVDEEAFKAWMRSMYMERGLHWNDCVVRREHDW
jgi:hypothetical protein